MNVRVAPGVTMGSVLHRRMRIFFSVQPVSIRQASTFSRHPFPFPPRLNPTPHEIFHLPRSASPDEIKARYYELVKVYHPDASHGQHDLSPSMRNARFRAITHAYGVLRGRDRPRLSGGGGAWDYCESRDEAMRAELRRRSRRSRSASASTTAADGVRHRNVDDAQLRYTLMALVLAGMIAAMSSASSHLDRVDRHSKSAAANLVQARAEAQAYGMERRRNIRERVRAFHEEGEMVNVSEHPEMHRTSKVLQSEPLRGETGPRKCVE